MEEGKKQWALNKSMAICSKSEKCIADIEKKLMQWEISTDAIQEIISTLVEQKFIDEVRYAKFYVRDKFRFNRWGKRKITYMLKGKGIPSATVFEAIQEIDDNEYFNVLVELLKSKLHRTKFRDNYEKKAKLLSFAQGRGFEYDIISEAIYSISNGENSSQY